MAGNLYVFSGAGLSKESGIDTFREDNGIWDKYSINEVCNFNTWFKNFDQVHDFYDNARNIMNSAKPNKAHITLFELQKYLGNRFFNFTQNVDNLLEYAGCVDVCHVHGDINKMQCINCNHEWSVYSN